MITLDTNVLVRILIDDGSRQQIIAARNLARKEKQVYILQIVQIELVWVLQGAYHLSKKEILLILKELLENDAFVLQHEEEYAEALNLFHNKNIEFSDCLILAESNANNISRLYTFDKKLSRLPHVFELT